MNRFSTWTDVRSQAAHIIADATLDVQPLNLGDWLCVERRVTGHFTGRESEFYWSWENAVTGIFPYLAKHVPDKADVAAILSNAIPATERVWLFLEDVLHGKTKFWDYEGTLPSVLFLIAELPSCDFYIVSKKLSWLVGQDHHDVLYAVGSIVETMGVHMHDDIQ